MRPYYFFFGMAPVFDTSCFCLCSNGTLGNVCSCISKLSSLAFCLVTLSELVAAALDFDAVFVETLLSVDLERADFAAVAVVVLVVEVPRKCEVVPLLRVETPLELPAPGPVATL